MGKWLPCNTLISSSIKWGDDSYPEGYLGQLKAPLAPCSAYSRCSITITSKDELPECIQALHTYNSLASVPLYSRLTSTSVSFHPKRAG